MSALGVLASFFDITEDSKAIFRDTEIMKTEYAKQLNCYPTIFLSFADAKGSIKTITKFIKIQIAKAYTRYMQFWMMSIYLKKHNWKQLYRG